MGGSRNKRCRGKGNSNLSLPGKVVQLVTTTTEENSAEMTFTITPSVQTTARATSAPTPTIVINGKAQMPHVPPQSYAEAAIHGRQNETGINFALGKLHVQSNTLTSTTDGGFRVVNNPSSATPTSDPHPSKNEESGSSGSVSDESWLGYFWSFIQS